MTESRTIDSEPHLPPLRLPVTHDEEEEWILDYDSRPVASNTYSYVDPLDKSVLRLSNGEGSQKISEEQIDELVTFILLSEPNRRISFRQLACGPYRDWKVEESLISSLLMERGYHRYIVYNMAAPSQEVRNMRIRWAESYRHWSVEDWENVLWTHGNWDFNEKWPTVTKTLKAEEVIAQTCITSRLWVKEDWKFWGCFTGSTKGPSVSWVNDSWDPVDYNFHFQRIPPLIEQFISDKPWLTVMLENHPDLEACIEEKCRQKKIPTLKLPMKSPDLNPIEPIWNLMRKRVLDMQENKVSIDSNEELKGMVVSAWESINARTLMSFVKSMPKRCQAVLDANGGYFRY